MNLNFFNNFFTSEYHFEVQNISSFTKGMKMGLCFFLIITGIILLGQNTTLAQITINKSVAASTDDAEQQGADGSVPGGMFLNDTDLELVRDIQFPGYGTQKVGMRFLGISIPQGATITGAFLTFRAVAADAPMTNSEATNLTFNGHLIANAPTFTLTNNNIGSRTLTSASATWAPSAWTTGANINSPSMVSIIQEIVNQGTWASGNALAIIVSGTGHRSAASWDGDNINAPKLTITYTTTPPIVLSTSVINVLCRGNATGAINLTVTGGIAPYTYDWNNNGITSPGSYPDPEDISSLIAGSYLVNVKDAAGATASLTVSVTQPGAALTLSTLVSNVTSPGGSNGAIDLTPSGGTPGYTYLWTGGVTTQDRSGLIAGTYTVTATDANGCTSTLSSTIIESINQAVVNKQLYLDGTLGLSRDNPANPADNSTATTATLGIGLEKSLFSMFGNNTTNFQKYNITNNSWSAMTPTPVAVRNGGAIATSGSYIYSLLGNGATNFRRYDPAANIWSTMAAIPATVSDGGALVAAGGFIYAFRGTSTTTFYRYDIGANTWSTMAVAPAAVGYGGALVYDGTNIYAFGGDNTTNFWRYNIGANTWTTMAVAPAQVDAGGALAYDGTNIYALRGNGQKAFWRYNIGSNTWTLLADAPGNFAKGAGLVFDGTYFYATRGGGQKVLYRYDKALNSWATMAPTLINISDGGALVVYGDGNQGVASVTFTESPALCSALTIKAGQAITVQNYINIINGSMPANPNITATLKYGATTIATLSNPSYSGGLLTWTTSIAGDVTVPAGQAITLTITTAQSGVSFQIRYDSQTYPSKITLPVSTFINVNSIQVFSAAYPNGSVISNVPNSGTSYVRIAVSDPFGTADINGVNLKLTKPGGATINVILGASNVVHTAGCVKTYQYAFVNPVDLGSWNINAIAKEGTEGTVTHSQSVTVNVIVPTGPVTQIKQLYFNDALGLDRSNPANPVDNTTAQTAELSFSLTKTYTDNFNANGSYAGTNGTEIWSTNWVEEVEADGAGTGDLEVIANVLSIQTNAVTEAVYRQANLTGATAATLSLNLTSNTIGAGRTDKILLEISSNGGSSYTTLDTYTDGSLGVKTYNILSYVASNTRIRLRVFEKDQNRIITFDNISISYTVPGALQNVSFTEAPVLCSPLTIKASQTISVSAYVSVISGSMPATPSITAILKSGITPILTMSAPSYDSGTGIISWTGTIGSDVTVPASGAVVLDITTAQSGVAFKIDYDSQTKPSKIDLPVSTYIDITAMNMYNAPYPGGSIITNANNGGTVYLRATVTDPFGFNDITALDIAILNPNGSTTNVSGTSVATAGCAKTYEYVWNSPATAGDYSFTGTAKEGTENLVIDIEYLNFSLCPITVTATLTVPPTCNVLDAGIVELGITGGDGPYTYTWTSTSPAGSGSGTGQTITGLTAGSYTFTVTSAGGCTGSTFIVIAIPSGPVLSTNTNTASCLGNDGSIDSNNRHWTIYLFLE